jgi:predicted TIM-barrel fold metal-dependent hydrolase
MTKLIIDAHTHVFPYLGGKSGWESVEAHLEALQRLFCVFGSSLGITSELPDIQFRVGKFGRFEWTEDGEDYYRQVMPPSLQDQITSPEYLIAQMEYADIDIAVLQNAKVYGKLNDYFAESVRKYPSRLIGLAEINELESNSKSEILRLRHAVKQLGLKGIFYQSTKFIEIGNLGGFNDKKYDLFWREVSDLGIMVDWLLLFDSMSKEICIAQIKALSVLAEKFPDIPLVITQGLPVSPFKARNSEVRYPKNIIEICKKPNIFLELVYPISAGRLDWDYPFPEAQQLIRQLYELFGAHKLIWGSDMPNVERNCTYKQSLSYLKDYCTFIGREDMDMILGGNMARILKIPTDISRIISGPKRGPVM